MITYDLVHREVPDMEDKDIRAFLRFCEAFECLDSESYQEAHNKVLMTMRDINREITISPNADSQREVFERRYGPFLNLVRRDGEYR